jgi:DNA-binding transcriptional LysR family regulator
MTLEQLRIFVAVAEFEHVTRASRHLNLTQSATSSAIAALEARYATKLFDRVGRRIALTEAGRLFMVEAKAVLARAATAETVLADLAGLARGSLRISSSQTVGNYWLPTLINQFRVSHPGISLRLTLGNTETVAAAVYDGAAELGFIEGAIDDPNLIVQPVAVDRLMLVAAHHHAWATTPPRSQADYSAVQWLCRERGSGTRTAHEAALLALGLDGSILGEALELPSNEAICSAVEAGTGVTVLSSLVIRRALQARSLMAVDVDLPTRSFYVLRHKERYLTQASAAFQKLAMVAPGCDISD